MCTVCSRRYSALETISTQSPDGMRFLCDDCGNSLTEGYTDEGSNIGKVKLRNLMHQLSPIINLLRQIDNIVIPTNTFEMALLNGVPPLPQNHAGLVVPILFTDISIGTGRYLPFFKPMVTSNSAKAAAAVAPERQNDLLQVNFTSIQQQQQNVCSNELPTWYLESTLGMSMYFREDPEDELDSASTVGAEEGPKVIPSVKPVGRPVGTLAGRLPRRRAGRRAGIPPVVLAGRRAVRVEKATEGTVRSSGMGLLAGNGHKDEDSVEVTFESENENGNGNGKGKGSENGKLKIVPSPSAEDAALDAYFARLVRQKAGEEAVDGEEEEDDDDEEEDSNIEFEKVSTTEDHEL